MTPEEDKDANCRIQDFIEKYYPNYYRCDNIALEGDLYKIMDGEWDDGDRGAGPDPKEEDAAHYLLRTEFDGNPDHPGIVAWWARERIKILTLACNAYEGRA